MFDQTPNPKDESQPLAPNSGRGPVEAQNTVPPPSNLPQMSNTPQTDPVSQAAPKAPQVEDIFSETEAVSQPQIAGPTQPGQASQMPISNQDFGGKSIFDNKVLIAIIAVVILAVIAGVVWFVASYLIGGESSPVDTNQNTNINEASNNNSTNNTNQAINNTSNTNTNINTNNNFNDNENINTNTNENIVIEKDSDNDGLSDKEERLLGTDPYNFDTDGDGLTDYAEVRIYKTDPLNPDTDGDGYSDGDEVINGFDPNKGGGARLFDVP